MQNQFAINEFFNNQPIRIIGTPEEPIFYASDIGDILGLTKVSMSIKNFDDTEIVTPDVRQRLGLITYYKYKDEMRRDDRIILLTEFGVYRLIINSRSNLAAPFKKHIYEVIKKARLAEKEKLQVLSIDDFNSMKQKLETLEKSHAEYVKYNPAIYVFRREINDNPYKFIKMIDLTFEPYYNEKHKYLYKFTTSPDASDYTECRLHAKIYGDTENIMDELVEGCLEVDQFIHIKSRYHVNFDFDISGKVVFE